MNSRLKKIRGYSKRTCDKINEKLITKLIVKLRKTRGIRYSNLFVNHCCIKKKGEVSNERAWVQCN